MAILLQLEHLQLKWGMCVCLTILVAHGDKEGVIDDKLQDDGIGRSVSLNSDGNTVAVGSGGNGRGFARVYAYNGSGWQQRGDDIAPSTTSNGHIVSLSSDGNVV
eukprot:718132_1